MSVKCSQIFAISRKCWPLLLGNVLEWYEFGIYAYLADEIDTNFFQGSKIAVWLGFALTFVARPLGGMLLGFISDKYGRRFAMNISGLGMLLATVCQGLLPTYVWGGKTLGRISVVLLFLLRFLQGISAGGEICVVHAYLVEMAPLESLALVQSLAVVGGNISFLLASVTVSVVARALPGASMDTWGWRLPFLLALPPGLLAAWGRSRFPESELFLQDKRKMLELATTPEQLSGLEAGGEDGVREDIAASDAFLVKTYWPSILIGIAAPAAGATALYVNTMWCLTYIHTLGIPAEMGLFIGCAANVVSLFTTPVFAYLADIHGVAFILMMCGVSMILIGFPGIALLVAYPGNTLVAFLCIGVGYGCVRGLYTNTFVFCAELFPTAGRSRGLGLSLNIGVTLFGGFGGLLAQASLSVSPWGPGYLMAVTGAITICTVMCSLQLRQSGYPVAHRRQEPYYGANRELDGSVKVEAAMRDVSDTLAKPKKWTAPERPAVMAAAWSKPAAHFIGHVEEAEPEMCEGSVAACLQKDIIMP